MLASMGAGKDSKGATRTKAQTEGRVTGTLTEWKGSFGWIEPDEPVDQPDAGTETGEVSTLRTKTLRPKPRESARRSFLLYTDGRGLDASPLSQRVAQVPGSRSRRSHQSTVARLVAKARVRVSSGGPKARTCRGRRCQRIQS